MADKKISALPEKSSLDDNDYLAGRNAGDNNNYEYPKSVLEELNNNQIKVSSNDTTAKYLLSALVAGTNISLTEQNDGGDETIKIDATESQSNKRVIQNPASYLSVPNILARTDLNGTANQVDRVYPSWNTGASIEYYAGQHKRLYFTYIRDEGANLDARIGYYDYEAGDITIQEGSAVGLSNSPSDDFHNGYTLTVTNDGYILIAANWDDGNFSVWKSDSPEDISSFTAVSDSPLDSYSNYACLAKNSKYIVADWRGDGSGGSVQEDRALSYSSDNGENWSTNVNYITLNFNHWAYGRVFPTQKGFLLTICINHTAPADNNYLKWGLIYTKDFQNFGDMEYYATDGKSGWSKDVDTNGAITETEFTDNLVVIDSTYDLDEHNYLIDMILLPDGNIACISDAGTRVSETVDITGLRTSIYDVNDNTWTHNIVADENLPVSIDTTETTTIAALVPCDISGNSFKMIIRTNADTNKELDLWSTGDKGASWNKIADITSTSSADIGYLNISDRICESQSQFIMTNDNGNIRLICFDNNIKSNDNVVNSSEPNSELPENTIWFQTN